MIPNISNERSSGFSKKNKSFLKQQVPEKSEMFWAGMMMWWVRLLPYAHEHWGLDPQLPAPNNKLSGSASLPVIPVCGRQSPGFQSKKAGLTN